MKLFTNFRTNRNWVILSSIFLFSTFIALCTVNTTSASTAGFIAGRIIDDNLFTSSSSMNTSQIQAFLNSKVPTCDTQGSIGPYYDKYGTRWNTRADFGRSVGSPPPYTCLKDYTENNKGAAQIIYDISQTYSINPQVLIVLLQKEQGLVTDDWPFPVQYQSATGYGCPDTASCSTKYYGLTAQLTWSGTMFHSIVTNNPNWSNPYASGTSWYSPYVLGDNLIKWHPDFWNAATSTWEDRCGASTVNIQNRATQALYNYTPYQPNSASLNAGYGTGDSCSSYGNRNFYLYFTDWFGSSLGTVYNGVDYKDVYDGDYYLNTYTDLKASYGNNYAAAIAHFVQYGMNEGRQGISSFNVTSYKNRYYDLRASFGNNLKAYYSHYITSGKREGRIATGNEFNGTPIYNGVDYSAVYDYTYYINNYADVKASYGTDDVSAIAHFVQYGMNEGRQGISSFNVQAYRANYSDLQSAFGNNLKAYYLHYMNYGKKEGRIAI